MKRMMLALTLALPLAAPLPLMAQPETSTPPANGGDTPHLEPQTHPKTDLKAPDADGTTHRDDSFEKLSNRFGEALQQFQERLPGLMDESGDQFADLADRAGPALRNFIDQMGPALSGIVDQIRDFSNYEAPQVLPNGDILIRRKETAPQYMPPVPGQNPDGSVDL